MGICVVYPFILVPINGHHCKAECPFNLVPNIIYTLWGNEMGICVVYPYNLVPINVHQCKAERPFKGLLLLVFRPPKYNF